MQPKITIFRTPTHPITSHNLLSRHRKSRTMLHESPKKLEYPKSLKFPNLRDQSKHPRVRSPISGCQLRNEGRRTFLVFFRSGGLNSKGTGGQASSEGPQRVDPSLSFFFVAAASELGSLYGRTLARETSTASARPCVERSRVQ